MYLKTFHRMWLPAISPRRTLSRNNFLWNLFNLSAVVLCVACCFCIWPSRHLTFETARKLMPLARPMWRTRLPTYASGLRRRGGEKRPKNLSKIRVRKRGSVNKLLLFWTLDSSTYYTYKSYMVDTFVILLCFITKYEDPSMSRFA